MKLMVSLLCGLAVAGCGGSGEKSNFEKAVAAETVRKFAILDINRDGSVSSAEIETVSAQEFAQIKNAGIVLDLPDVNGVAAGAKELLAVHKARITPADKNTDGQITLAEYTAWQLTESSK